MYYLNRGDRAGIVTCTSYLADQFKIMLGDMRQRIPVMTTELALTWMDEFKVIVVDEADACMIKYGCIFNHEKELVVGYWEIFARKTFLLTAPIGIDL